MRRILPVVGVVVVVLVLGFVVLGSCSGTSKADKYRSYVQDVNSVARQSNNDARALDAALYNQELTPNQVTTRVASFIPRARAAETTAAALKPPGKIKEQELQRYLLQALQYRTLALQDLQAALKTALAGTPNTPADRGAAQGRRQRLQRADRLRRRLRRQLPAARAGDPQGGERHRRADHGVRLEPLARARQPGLQRQRPLDRVGARRRHVAAVRGRRHRHLDRRGHGERQDAGGGTPRAGRSRR